MARKNKFITAAILGMLMLFISPISQYFAEAATGDLTLTAPYSTIASSFVSASKGSKIDVKWSRSYTKNANGSYAGVSGYEIQYATNSDFSNAKTIKKVGDVNTYSITLSKLNTKKKFDSSIKNYFVRVRSYTTIDKVTSYSAWRKSVSSKKVTVYYPVTKSVSAEDNIVTCTWESQSACDGYLVYMRKGNTIPWKKKSDIQTSPTTSVKYELEFNTKYQFNIMAYQTITTTDPRSYNTTTYAALYDSSNAKKITTPKYTTPTPVIDAYFKDTILNIEWKKPVRGDEFYIELAKDKDFNDKTEIFIDKTAAEKLLNDGKYNKTINGLAEKTAYYIRMAATSVYNNAKHYSKYSDVKTASFEIPKYTISFDGNGASSGEMDGCMVPVGEDFALPGNNFKKNGYTFIGWSLTKGEVVGLDSYQIGEPAYEDGETIKDIAEKDGEIKLYACWKGTGPIAAADWALAIAKDDSFEYGLVDSKGKLSKTDGHSHCWFCKGGLKVFCCNSLCAAAYQHGSGYLTKYWGGTTGPDGWVSRGFTDLGRNYDPAKIKKGDLICCWNGSKWSHIMMAASGSNVALEKKKIVNARGWDKGICTQNMLDKLDNYKYYEVLRLK